jgi:IS1 family transposase
MIGGWIALLVRDGRWDRVAGAGMFIGGSLIWLTGHIPCEYGRAGDKEHQRANRQPEPHLENVSQKLLHSSRFAYYNNYMANVLPTEKKIAIVSSLCEGSSIRSIERVTGVHRDTIMRLGVKVGQGCTTLMDAKMRNLECTRLEMDEIWGYVGKKEKHVRPGDDPQMGNVWTFCAIDADTKLVPAFYVAPERGVQAATVFVCDVADRLKNRVQISTDGLAAYVAAIELAFGQHNVDYGQIIKTYGTEESVGAQRRYSAPKITESEKKGVFGYPDWAFISTSYVERLNATTRLHMKRLARLTHAFSKKRENFEAAVGLHFAYYNFVRRHNTLRCTPAMAAGVEKSFWSVADLVEATA